MQSYGSDALDASNLMMPLVFFMSPSDPRMISTLDAINCSPEQGGLVSNSLVYRYNVGRTEDGIGLPRFQASTNSQLGWEPTPSR